MPEVLHTTRSSDWRIFEGNFSALSLLIACVRFSPMGESTARLIVLAPAADVYVLHDAVSSYPFVRLRQAGCIAPARSISRVAFSG